MQSEERVVKRLPPEDPLAAPPAAKRLATFVAGSEKGMRCAAWYLKHIVPRVEPALSRWSAGRMTSLPITPVVFLRTIGARTGEARVTPLTYFTDGDDVILIASNYGRPKHPARYFNVRSHPEVTLRARGREGRYAARETADAERDRLWALATRWTPPLTRYQTMAGGRTIPVMRCVPLG
jgi:deazaflavin-dependent oxidoreductase (nitroreductase family)